MVSGSLKKNVDAIAVPILSDKGYIIYRIAFV